MFPSLVEWLPIRALVLAEEKHGNCRKRSETDGNVLAWSCFRPCPTVSIFLSDELDQFRLWKADPVQTRANHDAQVFSCNLCARTLPQILHRDLDIQYFLKIPKSQELVKFDNLLSHFFGILTCGLHKETVPPFYTEKVMVIMSPRYEPNMGAVFFFTSARGRQMWSSPKKQDRIRFSWSFLWENMDFSPNRTSVFSHGKIQAKSTADVPNTWKTPHQSPHPQEFP